MLNMNVKFLLRIIIVNIAIVQTIQCPVNTMVNAARLCGTNYNQACNAYSYEALPEEYFAVDHINDNNIVTMAGSQGTDFHGWMEIDLGESREIKNVFTYIPPAFGTLGLNNAELRIGNTRGCSNFVCGESNADWGDGTENFETTCNREGLYFCIHSNGIHDSPGYALQIGELIPMTCPPTEFDCPTQSTKSHPYQSLEHCQCNTGYYGSISAQGGSCSQCPANSGSPIGSIDINNCTCSAGYTRDTTNVAACTFIDCAEGTYKDTVANTKCTPCPVGTFSDVIGAVSQEGCSTCPVGTYNNVTGAVSANSCIPCGVGTHPRSDGGDCEPCASSYSASLLTSAFNDNGKMPGCIEFVQ